MFCNKKILVVGDVMLDINYIQSTAARRHAPENSAVIIKPIETTQIILGGAANVALALHRMECDVLLLGVVGKDDAGKKLGAMLRATGINHKLFSCAARHTTQKHRIYQNSTLTTRFDVETTDPIEEEIENQILQAAAQFGANVIVFSDYDKGCLTERMCQTLIHRDDTYSFIDPKIKNFRKYRGCFCFKPNFYEASVISGHILQNAPATHIQNIQMCREIIAKIYDLVGCASVVLTDGANGMYVNEYSSEDIKHLCVAAVAGGEDVVDVTGAGDIVMAALVYGFCFYGGDLYRSAEMANYFGTKSVYVVGNYQIQKSDVVEYLQLRGGGGKLTTRKLSIEKIPKPHLVYPQNDITPEQIREHATRKNQRIVFTNGCFDIIHSAHLQLLNFCRTRGQILVVGLNSDESVRRLKGAARPINSQEERVAVLGELNYIDYIYVFYEDTPADLIERLRPNIIVKGGDYSAENVVGREFAERVDIFHTIPNKSTTLTIERAAATD